MKLDADFPRFIKLFHLFTLRFCTFVAIVCISHRFELMPLSSNHLT
jgi:hypothetical protein